MKNLLLFIFIFVSFLTVQANAFEGLNNGQSLKIFNRIDCGSGIDCSRGANGKFNMTASAQTEGLTVARLAIFDYDFAVDGGTIGTIASGVTLPAKAIIEKCWFRVETQIVDAGAGTLAVQCEDADNILTAADQSGLADGTFLASNITGAAAAMVDDIAAACDISWVIGGAAISAGKVRGYCRYSVHE